MDLHFTRCFVRKERHQFFDEMSEDLRVGVLIAENRQFMGDEWMIGDDYSHGDTLLLHNWVEA
jgi:hypothetical protein